MELFLSRRGSAGHDGFVVVGEVADRADGLDGLGVPERMPFILGDDGSYDLRLNQFLRELPTMGVSAETSWLAYARDLLTWTRFLAEQRSTNVWEADQADVAAFHSARRLGPATTSVSSATWDRNIAALDKFYRWSTERGHVTRPPFSYRAPRGRAGHGRQAEGDVLVNLAKERRGRRHAPGFLPVEDYVVFREVGLRGRLPDGCPDPAWRGRNGERNALFAELLVTTGMRLEEAATLLWPELPPAGGGKSQPLELAPAVTKRGRGRTIRVPNRLLVSIGSYRVLERANALSRATTSGLDVEVVGWERRGCRVVRDGRRVRVPFARMSARDRMGSWVRGDSGRPEPLVVWVAEGGRPVGVRAWEAIFERACARCCTLGVPVEASPHTLRHTFAVHMLSLLIREQVGSLAAPQADTENASYRRMVGDPLQHLQRLLGHASIASTYTYLDSVTEAQLLVDDAVDRWAAELGTGAEDPPA